MGDREETVSRGDELWGKRKPGGAAGEAAVISNWGSFWGKVTLEPRAEGGAEGAMRLSGGQWSLQAKGEAWPELNEWASRVGGEAGPRRAWWPPEHFGLILSDMGATALCKGNRQWGLAHSGEQGAGRPGSRMLAGERGAGSCGAELWVDGGVFIREATETSVDWAHLYLIPWTDASTPGGSQ